MLFDRIFCVTAGNAWVEQVDRLAQTFAARAFEHDRDGTFPDENVDALIDQGYTALTVPVEYGGQGASLGLVVALQQRLARGDASTALAVGWHLTTILGLRESRAYPEQTFARICRDVVERGGLVNTCASERVTGSPSRGGLPGTQAVADGTGFRLTGRKTWATLSPRLTWFIVTAALDDGRIGEFVIPSGTPGLSVEKTWDSLSLRASGSHDVVLDRVWVPAEALVSQYAPSEGSPRGRDGSGPLLHVPACYLGVALAARAETLQFSRSRRPSGLARSIAELPEVQAQLGRMDLALYPALALLDQAAKCWDETPPADRPNLRGLIGAAKVVGTEAALQVVDLSMRIVGAVSLSHDLPLERYYRDVRAGLHNPPMADGVTRTLAREALAEEAQDARK